MSKFGLIGRGIEHSQSPFLHKIIGNYEYDLLDVADESALKEVLDNTEYEGFNVTMPYKETVIKYLDKISDKAREANAVNTIKRLKDGRLIGFNTDIHGFTESVGERVHKRKCLILGTGGGATAVYIGLKNAGAAETIFVSRNPEEARARIPEGAAVISYDDLDEHRDAQVIINATSVGDMNSIGQTPLSNVGRTPRLFTRLELAMDLIYNPYRTKFLQDARRMTGCKTASGLEMLIHQAIAARNIWMESPTIHSFEKIVTSAIKRKLLTRQLNIVAVGMPGSGKTTIFRRYAYELKLDFIDVDQITEELMGDTIENVLNDETRGEAYFREYEHKAVLQAARHNRAVIATGGGSVLNPINRDVLRSNGIIIYVKRPLEMLATGGRPLSQEVGVEQLFEERSHIYSKIADIILDNSVDFGSSLDKNGEKNSYGYDMKAFVFKAKASIEKYIYNIAGNKWV